MEKLSLEELEKRYFMLQMVDRWTDEDYKYAQVLREEIRKRKEDAKEN